MREYSFVKNFSVPKQRTTEPDLTGVGRRIRQIRAAERQQDFASFLGITQGLLSKVESGRIAPSLRVLLRLKERSGRKTDWILTGQD